jgi:hypothetical protein
MIDEALRHTYNQAYQPVRFEHMEVMNLGTYELRLYHVLGTSRLRSKNNT